MVDALLDLDDCLRQLHVVTPEACHELPWAFHLARVASTE